MEYSLLSKTITKSLDRNTKKNNGIFFTPPETVKRSLSVLKSQLKNVKTILEPSCGSCEFILPLLEKSYKLTGIEYNKDIYESIKYLQDNKNDLTLIQDDFISWNSPHKYDLIIGNPPFYVMPKNKVDKKYYKYFTGRPNIFILFIIKSLSLLNKGGILSFVLPTSFLNSSYYKNTRKYINDNFKILNILNCKGDYLETKQNTVILIIQNIRNRNIFWRGKIYKIIDNSKFILNKYDNLIFGTHEKIHKLRELYKGSTTLNKMGFSVNVGNIVWNQRKKYLTDDTTKTHLIYSSDIRNNKLVIQDYKNPEKKNYIDCSELSISGETKPLLVVNRGYGNANYKFSYLLLKGDFKYLIENHLICIRYKGIIDDDKLLTLYDRIIHSFNDENTREFIKIFSGNNAMTTNELCNMLPIYC